MMTVMRRIQIHIDEALDARAEAEASRRGISKAALIRSTLAQGLTPAPAASTDPWQALVGWLDDDPVDDIDAVIYERSG